MFNNCVSSLTMNNIAGAKILAMIQSLDCLHFFAKCTSEISFRTVSKIFRQLSFARFYLVSTLLRPIVCLKKYYIKKRAVFMNTKFLQ
jgi:hypothetical protein